MFSNKLKIKLDKRVKSVVLFYGGSLENITMRATLLEHKLQNKDHGMFALPQACSRCDCALTGF